MTTQAQAWQWTKWARDNGHVSDDARVVLVEWSGKLRTAISLAESRLDADSFAHSMRVAARTGENLPGHRDPLGDDEDKTAGLKAMVVAVLHDLIEDQTRGQVVHFGHLADEFGEEVSEAVETLTRPVATGVTYRDYIDDVSTNALATQVKIADLEDHLSEANASTLKPTLRPRYERAWSRLTATMRRDALEHSWRADDIKRSTLKRLAIQRRG